MILDEKEIKERMTSPLNLMNRLKEATTKKQSSTIPSLPPSATELIENIDEKLSRSHTALKGKAVVILAAAMSELERRIPEVQRPEQLAKIAETMSKVISSEDKNTNKDESNRPQFVIYAPSFNHEEHYDTTYVRE